MTMQAHPARANKVEGDDSRTVPRAFWEWRVQAAPGAERGSDRFLAAFGMTGVAAAPGP